MTTAHHKAYIKIKSAIIDGEFGPGFHLKEEDLTKFCQTGRTPIRQAIRKLEKEGLVVFRENRGSFVPDIDQSEAEQAFDILAKLESYSATLAARRISDSELSNLKKIMERFDNFTDGDQESSLEALYINNEFHQAIHAASGNLLLQDLIKKTTGVTFNMYIKHQINGNPKTASQEHWEIIHALENRDETHVSLLMNLHVESVRRVYRDFWMNSQTF